MSSLMKFRVESAAPRAGCAILCTAETSVKQFETLLRKLGDMFRGVKPGYEYISGNKVLLRKPLR